MQEVHGGVQRAGPGHQRHFRRGHRQLPAPLLRYVSAAAVLLELDRLFSVYFKLVWFVGVFK